MPRDCAVEIRRTFVTLLHDDPAISAIVGEEVYGPSAKSEPTWPFIRCDSPPSFPDYDGCSDASRYVWNIHAFVAGEDERGARQLANLIVKRLDGQAIKISEDTDPDAWLRDTLWTGTQVLGDTERSDGWHAVIGFEARVSADAI